MNYLLLILLSAAFVLPGSPSKGQRQGIRGEVLWFGGNQMPAPGKTPTAKLGISREIHIYEVTTRNDVNQHSGPFFSELPTRLITTTTSSGDGSFKVKLPPGRYSLFVKEPQGLFANMFNTEGEINPVVVDPKKFTWVTLTVDYDAVY